MVVHLSKLEWFFLSPCTLSITALVVSLLGLGLSVFDLITTLKKKSKT